MKTPEETKRIYKYALESIKEQEIELPVNSKILTIENTAPVFFRKELYLWAIVNPSSPQKESIKIHQLYTGETVNIPESAIYIKTLFFNGSSLVIHFFYEVMI